MAIIQFGNGISQARGSIDGTVFSRSRAGAIARGRTKPVDPQTIYQLESRNRMSQVVAGWSVLDRGSVVAWNEWAQTQVRHNKLGEPFTPSGQQLFNELNLNLIATGASSMITSPPYGAVPPSIADLTVTAEYDASSPYAATLITADTLSGGGLGNFNANVWATPPHRPSVTNVIKMLKLIASGLTGGPALNVTAAYNARFGSPSLAGGLPITIRVQLIDIDSGLASPFMTETIIPEEDTP